MKTEPSDPIAAQPLEMAMESNGLTKREYFAAVALQGILAHDDSMVGTVAAELAVVHADRLIEILNRPAP